LISSLEVESLLLDIFKLPFISFIIIILFLSNVLPFSNRKLQYVI
jgi:hypothetical protein